MLENKFYCHRTDVCPEIEKTDNRDIGPRFVQRCEKNIMLNRLYVLNGKIDKSWVKLKFIK